MKFSAKVVTVIGGVSLLTFSGIKLRNMALMEHGGGIFKSEGNKNSNLSGRCNRGSFMRNSNTNVHIEDSDDLEIMDNRNMKANIVSSSVKVFGQTNTNFVAMRSNIQMKSDKNADINAEDVRCLFEKNSNLKYKGEGGPNTLLSKIIDNQNSDFKGKNNHIIALKNRNLKVSGNGNRLEVSHTLNHNIRPASTEINGYRNTFTVRSSGSKSRQFDIEYVDTAVIKMGEYQLGICHFDVVEYDDRINVTIRDDRNITYSIAENTSSKIVIQVEKNEIMQLLEIKGDRVEAVGLNSFNINVNFG